MVLFVVLQIKKFKDAMAKHGTERCSLGLAKGLEESELESLVATGELSADSPLMYPKVKKMEDLLLKSDDFSGVWSKGSNNRELEQQLMY